MAPSIKTCSACKRSLPIDQFGQCSGYRDGRRGQCNACRTAYQAQRLLRDPSKRKTKAQIRKNDLQQRYRLSPEEYDRILASQGERCSICEKKAQLHVDHCHKTGRVRGLLCFACNLALGRVGDDLEGIGRFVRYLERT